MPDGDEEDDQEVEEEEEDYGTQNEDDEEDPDDEDELADQEENELESYIRNINIDNLRIRARTAPLRPVEQVEQFKATSNFTYLE
jgi:hypothetical protein